jgi:DNA-binding PadR family transcriptional regulator
VGKRHVFQHGELPLVVLALVAKGPVHGYELMAQLKRLLGPDYEPSPGSVYPAIAALVAEGLVTSEGDGSRKRVYRTTAKGRSALSARRSALRTFEVRTGARLETGEVEDALGRFVARVARIAERLDPDVVEDVLDRAAAELETSEKKERTRRGR